MKEFPQNDSFVGEMKLIGHNAEKKHLKAIRDLLPEEIAAHKKYTSVFAEARDRLKLFSILHSNYIEWKSYVDSLHVALPINQDPVLELDRLLLNYLTCAYTIQEHFRVSFQRRCRKYPARQKEHEMFVGNLCKASWPFAFFLDFRGFVQHCGLGIGVFRHDEKSTPQVVIAHDAARLVAESKTKRAWERSKLSGKEGELELVSLLEKFHTLMMRDYVGFVIKTFFPELLAAGQFYANLTDEVRTIDPKFRMLFGENEWGPKIVDGKKTKGFTAIHVPNDLFAELGISVSRKV